MRCQIKVQKDEASRTVAVIARPQCGDVIRIVEVLEDNPWGEQIPRMIDGVLEAMERGTSNGTDR